MASLVDWRAAFIIVGLAGVLIAPIFRLVVREPQRGRYDAKPEGAAKARLRSKRSASSPGSRASGCSRSAPSCSSIMGYGSFFWIPSFLRRSYGFDLQQAAFFYSAILLVGGVIGVWLGGLLGDKLGAKRRAMFALVPAAAWMLAAPVLRARPALALADGRVLPLPRAHRARPRLARPGHRRRAAPRARAHAHDRVGQLPLHQQPDRHRRRHVSAGPHVRRAGRALRR